MTAFHPDTLTVLTDALSTRRRFLDSAAFSAEFLNPGNADLARHTAVCADLERLITLVTTEPTPDEVTAALYAIVTTDCELDAWGSYSHADVFADAFTPGTITDRGECS